MKMATDRRTPKFKQFRFTRLLLAAVFKGIVAVMTYGWIAFFFGCFLHSAYAMPHL